MSRKDFSDGGIFLNEVPAGARKIVATLNDAKDAVMRGVRPRLVLLSEDVDVQLQAARQSAGFGHYATCIGELRAAILLLQRIEEEFGSTL